jgi:putative tryptophan/tyrosine transport system substrate-binding protein
MLDRRAFIVGLGGAAAWPLVARGQQQAMPVVGGLFSGPAHPPKLKEAFLQSLRQQGFSDDRNVTIEDRFADNQYDRLPALASDLVGRRVSVIVAYGIVPALAAKKATNTIPIVFGVGADPVKSGLVTSFNKPNGNATGVAMLNIGLEAKRLQILHEAVPNATVFAMLVNPAFSDAETQLREVSAAAAALGQQLVVEKASSEDKIDDAFASFARHRAIALLVAADPFFFERREQIIALAARNSLPAIYQWPEFVTAGGLMSYGTDLRDANHELGLYVARILKGDKPGDLPVQQLTKLELVINLKTAKALGLTFPLSLLGRADEVIE